MNTKKILHERFNPRNDQFSPIRLKGFKRVDIYKLASELNLRACVEVGTSQGLNAVSMCINIPGIHLICVDPYMKYHWKHSEDEHERCYQLAQERLKPFNTAIIRDTSINAVQKFEDNHFDLVYIDGNHEFNYVMEDLIAWWRKLKPGGIMALHDYYEFRGAGVVLAVDSFTRANHISEYFLCDFLLRENGKEPEYSVFWAKE